MVIFVYNFFVVVFQMDRLRESEKMSSFTLITRRSTLYVCTYDCITYFFLFGNWVDIFKDGVKQIIFWHENRVKNENLPYIL